ncbi:MAG: hypothetical protein JXA35_08315 [Deltaproteobacteria bacterium]|nr:hypothetical protein [Deltaproteobacteria bacterium]
MNLKKLAIIFISTVLLFAASASAVMAKDRFDDERISPDLAMAGDILFVRPLGIVGTAVGTVLFIVSVPFSAAGGNTKEAFKELVAEPAEYTFKRPLGKFRSNDMSH